MMEVEGARRLWTRSVAQHKLRYMTMLSDGDCKTFNELQNERPYGDVLIKKEECVNHVSKRMGTALRNLITDNKKRGVTLGGRGEGSGLDVCSKRRRSVSGVIFLNIFLLPLETNTCLSFRI